MHPLQLPRKIINTASYAFLLSIAVAVGAFTEYHRVSDETFSLVVTIALNVLLLGLTIFKWLPNGPRDVISEGLGYWYTVAGVSMGISQLFWHLKWTIAAIVLGFLTLFCLSVIYHRLRNYPPRHNLDFILINAPFSIWTSLELYTVLYNVLDFYHNNVSQRFPLIDLLLLVVLVQGLTSFYLLDFDYRKDWVFASTSAGILWVLAMNDLVVPDKPWNNTRIVAIVFIGSLVTSVLRDTMPRIAEPLQRTFTRERQPLLVDSADRA
jgi:hypothetical protein